MGSSCIKGAVLLKYHPFEKFLSLVGIYFRRLVDLLRQLHTLLSEHKGDDVKMAEGFCVALEAHAVLLETAAARTEEIRLQGVVTKRGLGAAGKAQKARGYQGEIKTDGGS